MKAEAEAEAEAEIVQSLKGRKRKNSANLEKGVKICIQGQFFVLKKTRWGTRRIFQCTP